MGRRREDRIVGASRATQTVLERASSAARSPLPVLIWGPPGSGKEFVARAIHAWGPRASASFDVLACGGVPEALQAREIFGCAAGVHRLLPAEHPGLLARTSGGTVLLDDIDALRPAVRNALCKALSEGSFTPEGASAERPLEARVIATSSLALADGPFGELPHHRIELLPLAERREDVLPLAAHFLATFAAELGLPAVGFSGDARAFLLAEPWPGNVRELRARIREAVRLTQAGAVSAESLLLAGEESEVPSFKDAKRAFETRYVVGLLRRCRGNISRAARLAKKDRKDFYDVIRRTGIDPTTFRHS
ncbi:MAG TPA: sigma 54-interacting transcriptional regulator [Myxococcota bacterium]|nr:sigma 54-interacting transcriptional regulator [Myxococcota bacterium]